MHWSENRRLENILCWISSVQSLHHVRLLPIPWTAALQASSSVTISRSLLKLMSVELVMPPNHLILCRPLLLLPPSSPSIRVFSNESTLCMRWPKYWSGMPLPSPSIDISLSKTPGDSEGQESLVCCSPWYREDSDTTWPLNNKVSSAAERWIHSCQSNFLQIEKQAIRKYCNHKHNHLACLHFLSLSLPFPQGEKRTEKKREKKASTTMQERCRL